MSWSSPPSSPCLDPLDSSPPSSPSHEFSFTNSPASPGLAHPFAASTKAIKPLPLYEKRLRPRLVQQQKDDDREDFGEDSLATTDVYTRALIHPLAGSAKALPIQRSHSRTSSQATVKLDGPGDFSSSRSPANLSHQDRGENIDGANIRAFSLRSRTASGRRHTTRQVAQRRWEDELEKVFMGQTDGIIDLNAEGILRPVLTEIPPSIGDLANIVLLDRDAKHATLSNVALGSQDARHSLRGLGHPSTRRFARSVTTPAMHIGSLPSSSLSNLNNRIASSSLAGSLGRERDRAANANERLPKDERGVREIQLHLEQNAIRRLPLELFSVVSLTVLRMRNNALTQIPPQVTHLVNLRELNVKQNKLRWLPAEMLSMKLEILEVGLNPWIKPPARMDFGPAVSQTKVHFTVASLTEYCLRVLLAPAQTSMFVQSLTTTLDASITAPVLPRLIPPDTQTVLDTYDPIAILERLPLELTEIIRACLPRAVPKPDPSRKKRSRMSWTKSKSKTGFNKDDIFPFELSGSFPQGAQLDGWYDDRSDDEDCDEDEETETHPGIGICPSPLHTAVSVFVSHAEERFSWEYEVAGVRVSEREGVPMLWRGCSRGCLAFLGADVTSGYATEGALPDERDDNMDVDEDEELDL